MEYQVERNSKPLDKGTIFFKAGVRMKCLPLLSVHDICRQSDIQGRNLDSFLSFNSSIIAVRLKTVMVQFQSLFPLRHVVLMAHAVEL